MQRPRLLLTQVERLPAPFFARTCKHLRRSKRHVRNTSPADRAISRNHDFPSRLILQTEIVPKVQRPALVVQPLPNNRNFYLAFLLQVVQVRLRPDMRTHNACFAGIAEAKRCVVDVLHACFEGGVDGSAVVFLAALPERRVVVVHLDAGRGDEEELVAALVGLCERGGVIEVGLTEGDVLGAEVVEVRGLQI